MRHIGTAAAIALAVGTAPLASPQAYSQQTAAAHGSFHTPDTLQWKNGPVSIPPGAKFIVLEGDPSAKGYFALRLALPDGYVIPPHWHPVQERVTVVSGTFEVGMGGAFDTDTLRANPVGSYVSLPPKRPHFARASGPTVIQLTSIGPWELHYVDPRDDPRKSRK